ncbi:hypothetical protein [Pseudomonas sp. nanlin1]|uniref:hypothetical protein n=1 Tax=Pseudomonas sp. nanlin1 TaxID=3040605 RepID=UPI00388DA5A5
MDDIQQLGDMLRHYADSEANKQRTFDSHTALWSAHISALYDQIESWLAPVLAPDLLEIQRSPYVASNAQVPAEGSPFKSEKLTLLLTAKPVEFVPEVMGAGGAISLAVMGLTSARHGSISLVCQPPSSLWQWRKTNGLKEADTCPFDANFLALQLQGLIPRERG